MYNCATAKYAQFDQAIATGLVGKELHEDAERRAPGHGRAHALEEAEQVRDADEAAHIVDVGQEGEGEAGDALQHRAGVEARLGADARAVAPEHGTETSSIDQPQLTGKSLLWFTGLAILAQIFVL